MTNYSYNLTINLFFSKYVTVKDEDGKQTKQFSCIIFILDEIGHVIGFQFTKSKSLTEVVPQLTAIKDRSPNLQMIHTGKKNH